MPIGPGIYDKLCTNVMEETNAETAIVIVIKGNLGTGFSIQTSNPIATMLLPRLLRNVANEIESSLTHMEGELNG